MSEANSEPVSRQSGLLEPPFKHVRGIGTDNGSSAITCRSFRLPPGPPTLGSEPLEIGSLREGALLKTGELLVVLHSLKRRYSDALVDLQKASKLKSPSFIGIVRSWCQGLTGLISITECSGT
jgi:hypothetical protein